MNARSFQFRIADLMLATLLVALAVAAAQEGLLYGPPSSSLLLLALAAVLGAITGRLTSGDVRFGLVGGLLLGAVGICAALAALSIGVRAPDAALCFVCVTAGGVLGGLLPTMLRKWRRASARSRSGLVLAGVGLLALFAWRWQTVANETRAVEKLQTAGAYVLYRERNPLPMIFDGSRMDESSQWLRKLLGLRFVEYVSLNDRVDRRYDVQFLVQRLPGIESLTLNGFRPSDKDLELLNAGRLPKLRTLYFEGRVFDDALLARLHPLPGLQFLGLLESSVTDESVEHLKTFPDLSTLHVVRAHITADGINRLKAKISRVLEVY